MSKKKSRLNKEIKIGLAVVFTLGMVTVGIIVQRLSQTTRLSVVKQPDEFPTKSKTVRPAARQPAPTLLKTEGASGGHSPLEARPSSANWQTAQADPSRSGPSPTYIPQADAGKGGDSRYAGWKSPDQTQTSSSDGLSSDTRNSDTGATSPAGPTSSYRSSPSYATSPVQVEPANGLTVTDRSATEPTAADQSGSPTESLRTAALPERATTASSGNSLRSEGRYAQLPAPVTAIPNSRTTAGGAASGSGTGTPTGGSRLPVEATGRPMSYSQLAPSADRPGAAEIQSTQYTEQDFRGQDHGTQSQAAQDQAVQNQTAQNYTAQDSSGRDYAGPNRYEQGSDSLSPAPRTEPARLPTAGQDDYAPGAEDYAPIRQTSDVTPIRENTGNYFVEPGDNFWKIARKVYGNGGYFKALAAHNAARFPQAGDLRIGDEIETPSVAALREKYSGLCPKERKVKPGTSRLLQVSSRGVVPAGSYMVQPGDTLYTIARYKLGSAKRWTEIYQLNRDTLGEDVDYLRPGIKLLLPAKDQQERVACEPADGYRR